MSYGAIGNVGNTMLGLSLIDMWAEARKKVQATDKSGEGSPLLAAVSAAFEQYISLKETQNAATIAGVVTYALTPKGGVQGISAKDMAPFLALNVMA